MKYLVLILALTAFNTYAACEKDAKCESKEECVKVVGKGDANAVIFSTEKVCSLSAVNPNTPCPAVVNGDIGKGNEPTGGDKKEPAPSEKQK